MLFNHLYAVLHAGRARGILHIQRLLYRYGYLDSRQDAYNPIDEPLHILSSPRRPELVDPAMLTPPAEYRRALTTFQLRYGLPSTGRLDAATTYLLTAPRCGNPDTPLPGVRAQYRSAFWPRPRPEEAKALRLGTGGVRLSSRSAPDFVQVEEARGLVSVGNNSACSSLPDQTNFPHRFCSVRLLSIYQNHHFQIHSFSEWILICSISSGFLRSIPIFIGLMLIR
ncbi:unnamed protein product [Protopolystoma xenopodis]|uniref:Peptidoglycan binding-like domain-containing protein n=1 Tax=Protopolystoma xenopodis TaxID=117903 RepID=A0A3S5CNP0_9PLAT|nr:unnamed protein product [Protopolystoma xenopodis]